MRGDAAAGDVGPEGPTVRLGAHGPSQGESCGGTASSSSSLASLLAVSARGRDHRAHRGQGERRDHHPLGVPGAGRSPAAQAARIPADRVQGYLRDNNARILQEAIDDMLLVQRAPGHRPQDAARWTSTSRTSRRRTRSRRRSSSRSSWPREGMTLDELKRNMGRNILRRQILSARSRAQGRGHGHRGPGRLRRPEAGVQPPGAPSSSRRSWSRATTPRPGPRTWPEGPRRRGLRRPGREPLRGAVARRPGASSASSRAGR